MFIGDKIVSSLFLKLLGIGLIGVVVGCSDGGGSKKDSSSSNEKPINPSSSESSSSSVVSESSSGSVESSSVSSSESSSESASQSSSETVIISSSISSEISSSASSESNASSSEPAKPELQLTALQGTWVFECTGVREALGIDLDWYYQLTETFHQNIWLSNFYIFSDEACTQIDSETIETNIVTLGANFKPGESEVVELDVNYRFAEFIEDLPVDVTSGTRYDLIYLNENKIAFGYETGEQDGTTSDKRYQAVLQEEARSAYTGEKPDLVGIWSQACSPAAENLFKEVTYQFTEEKTYTKQVDYFTDEGCALSSETNPQTKTAGLYLVGAPLVTELDSDLFELDLLGSATEQIETFNQSIFDTHIRTIMKLIDERLFIRENIPFDAYRLGELDQHPFILQ